MFCSVLFLVLLSFALVHFLYPDKQCHLAIFTVLVYLLKSPIVNYGNVGWLVVLGLNGLCTGT